MWKVPEVMATIGPTLEKPDDLRRAIEVGACWFRLPCGYRQRPHVENARAVRAAAASAGVPVQLLLDLPSSRPRTGSMAELRLDPGAHVLVWDPEHLPAAPSNNGAVPVPLPGLNGLLPKLAPDHRMWFCDGRLEFVVDALPDRYVLAHLERGAIPLKSSNAIYLPDSANPFTIVTRDDHALLTALAAAGITPDWVALSLVSAPEDVRDGRREVATVFGGSVKLMAKFETTAALEVIEPILEVSEGLMVARGDLGPAVGFIGLPEAQERLVAAARRAGKPAVVATQVLENFAETGLPQRAELADLSLIARQQADVVMLGKETVYSPRPLECIQFARKMLTYETRRFEAAAGAAAPAPTRPARGRRAAATRT
jgi:pyruvate kinase